MLLLLNIVACLQDALRIVTGVQSLPSLVSINTLTTSEGQPLMRPFWGAIAAGTSYGISEADVNKAYIAGLKQGSPHGSPVPVELSLPSGQYTATAAPLPPEYPAGRWRSYWDTISWGLPYSYPLNVTFMLTGNM